MSIMYYYDSRKSMPAAHNADMKKTPLPPTLPHRPAHRWGFFYWPVCGMILIKPSPKGEGAPKGRMRGAFPRQTVNGWLRQTGPSSGRFTVSFPQGGTFTVKVENHMAKSRGVRGAAGACAAASLVYLLGRSLLALLVSALMGLAHPGASLAKPLGFSDVSAALFQLLVGIGAIALTLAFLLKLTRLRQVDLRIALPAPWSPGFCLPVFLGVANLANLAGALINHITDNPTTSELLPSGGPELLVCFITLCIMPAVAEELLFRGAFQGLMRPCGSAAAIFAPALLFGLLHLDLAQGLTAFACGVFLGWLTERSGSILPGMLLHLANNTLAFLTIYLRYYAPAELSFGVELFILLFFPVFGGWMIWNARQQGFRFSAGLRPGVDVLAVFTSPAYSAAVIFLVVYAVFFVH